MNREPIKRANFTAYHAGALAVDPSKPWQIITNGLGCLVAKLWTREQAITAVDALQADWDAGTLPCRLSDWDKHHLLKAEISGSVICIVTRDDVKVFGPATYNDCWLHIHKGSSGNSVDWLVRHEGYAIIPAPTEAQV